MISGALSGKNNVNLTLQKSLTNKLNKCDIDLIFKDLRLKIVTFVFCAVHTFLREENKTNVTCYGKRDHIPHFIKIEITPLLLRS